MQQVKIGESEIKIVMVELEQLVNQFDNWNHDNDDQNNNSKCYD